MRFDDYLIRASGIGNLMGKPRGDAYLTKTAQSYLRQLWIESVYGRVYDPYSKYLEKGTLQEETSITLLQDVRKSKRLYDKNEEQFENKFIVGTPDIITEDSIIDIKTKWDIWTFAAEEPVEATGRNSNYYWQVQAYMWLTGKKKAEVVFTLVDTPEHLVYSEFQKTVYNMDATTEELNEIEDAIRLSHTYDDIDKVDRIKAYSVTSSDEAIWKIKDRVAAARMFLNQLSL